MKTKKMSEDDKQEVLSKLDYEGGFEYLVFGSQFEEYTDPTFRRLVKQLEETYEALTEFLGELKLGDEEDEEDFE